MQVYIRPKKFLLGSSLTFNLKEGPVRCAKVCHKSWVILIVIWVLEFLLFNCKLINLAALFHGARKLDFNLSRGL